jgi:chromosome segregation ATPase
LSEEVQEMRLQLETEKTRGEELWEELSDTEQALAEVRSENSELKKTCAELRSQLEQERADRGEVEAQLSDREKQIEELRLQLAAQGERTPQHQLYSQIEELKERNRLLLIKSREERQKLEEKISVLEYRDKSQSQRLADKQNRLDELESAIELSGLKQKSAAARELPEAADILNQLKSKRKKSKADLTDLEVILEILDN